MTSSPTRLITRHEPEAPFLGISRQFKTARTERLLSFSLLRDRWRFAELAQADPMLQVVGKASPQHFHLHLH
jgi:hypothetical protein